MEQDQASAAGPDLAQGIPVADLRDGGLLLGHVAGEQVLLIRRGSEVFALGAHCTHYHGPLADGILTADAIRCPWHHARFDIRTGEAVGAPAFDPLGCWSVEHRDGRIFVREKREQPRSPARARRTGAAPDKVVIVGGGAAGFAAAEMLRREQFEGSIVMLSNDDAPPVDRPNLSKDYLAGKAPEDWVPLRPPSFYSDNAIDLRLGVEAVAMDPRSREVALSDGGRVAFDRLLLATGAEPVKLAIPGADRPHVRTLRSLADCRAIMARAAGARRAVVLGASFIGLEVAAALRMRGLEVHVVAPEAQPMERILGPDLGKFVRSLHEEHGVIFHLEDKASAIDDARVRLESDDALDADLVVVGIGVRPCLALAEQAGLTLDRGVAVNAFLETSAPGIFAAGDIARWPDPHSGQGIRVEHWVVAERQGQTAARNILGRQEKFADAPFFWSQHYDLSINYVGHAGTFDEIAIEGEVARKDCLVRFKHKGRVLAVASIGRDVENLRAELMMESAVSAISA